LLVPQGQYPTFFLYLEVDTESIDVNIHPTKTEVKFENEQAIWPILNATVREALGKSNAVPSIDFDKTDAPDIRVFTGDREVSTPKVHYDPGYNPFKPASEPANRSQPNWETLLQGFERKGGAFPDEASLKDYTTNPFFQDDIVDEPAIEFLASNPVAYKPLAQLFNQFILIQSGNRYLLVDQHLAHMRLLYEHYKLSRELAKVASQTLLFPELLELDPVKRNNFLAVADIFTTFGFEVDCRADEFYLNAVPVELNPAKASQLLIDLLDSFSEAGFCPLEEQARRVALSLAQSAAILRGKILTESEQLDLVERLFLLKEHAFAPDGKRIWVELKEETFRKLLTI
jgi:DNA mismatch repair protein MutL